MNILFSFYSSSFYFRFIIVNVFFLCSGLQQFSATSVEFVSKLISTATIPKFAAVLTFQFFDYLQTEGNFHKIFFFVSIRESIRLVIINKLRSATVKSIQRNIKVISFFLSLYSIEWHISFVKLRQVIKRFDLAIISYRKSFVNFKFRFFTSFNSTSLKSSVFRSSRFRSLFSTIKRRRLSFLHFSNSHFNFFFYFDVEYFHQQIDFFDFELFCVSSIVHINI